MLSSDSLLPTPEGIFSLYAGFFGIQPLPINISIGMPKTSEDMQSSLGSNWKKSPLEVNTVLMAEIARLLPPHARGFYGQHVKV
jgi:hypothetical protein